MSSPDIRWTIGSTHRADLSSLAYGGHNDHRVAKDELHGGDDVRCVQHETAVVNAELSQCKQCDERIMMRLWGRW